MCFAFHLLYIKGEYTPYTRENIRHIYKEEKEAFDAPRKKNRKTFCSFRIKSYLCRNLAINKQVLRYNEKLKYYSYGDYQSERA